VEEDFLHLEDRYAVDVLVRWHDLGVGHGVKERGPGRDRRRGKQVESYIASASGRPGSDFGD